MVSFVRSETWVRQIKYAAPGSVEAAAAILAEHGARARMLAGGTDLIVQIREWLRDVDVVVDAKQIPELTEIGFAGDGSMTLGAAAPCYQIYGNERAARTYPGLIDAVSMIGGTAIQGRASVGGNLCNSGPAGDSIPPLIGRQADEASYELAAAASRAAASPIDDMRGTIEYRKHMTGVLTVRALRGAVARAKGGRVNGH